MNINQALKKERERQGLTLYAVGKMVGVNPSHIEKIENETHKPSLPLLKKLCEAYGVDATFFHDGKEKLTKHK